jgi:GNAT superfamily N-acetyltransferase
MLSKNNLIIKYAIIEDIEALTLLMGDLGYPTSVIDMQARFENIAAHPDYKTIVAVLDNEVVGMAGLSKGIFYEMNGTYMRILAFVVKQGYRKMGIGRQLIAAAENWAVEQGLNTVIINSGNRDERLASHAFYGEMGYTVKSLGFVKKL